jgi:carbonic anhydrase
MRPKRRTIVVACCDGRVDPAHVLGLEPGEALVIRNPGGRVTQDVQRQLALFLTVFEQAGGEDRIEIVLIHHPDCGMERLGDPEVRSKMSSATGIGLEYLEELAIDERDTLAEDIGRLRASSVLPKGSPVTAVRYDPASGRAEIRFEENL